jgi:hypothetical protein
VALILYDASTGEIRARAFDEPGTPITDATLTCTLYDSQARPETIFSDRAMPYDAGHAFTGPGDLGCYFCTVSAGELDGPEGVWKAIITAVDSLANTLVINAYINVTPFVVA